MDPNFNWAIVADDRTIRNRTIGALRLFDPKADTRVVYPRQFDVPAVRSFLESCAGRVVLEFFRFPFATIEDEPDGGRSLVVRDARYTRRGRGFAVFSARLAPDGAPVIDPGGCP